MADKYGCPQERTSLWKRVYKWLYRRIAEEINTLKEEQIEARRKKWLADNYEQWVKDMDNFMKESICCISEFDNDLVRRLISSIKVVSAEKQNIQFRSEIVMEQEIRYDVRRF